MGVSNLKETILTLIQRQHCTKFYIFIIVFRIYFNRTYSTCTAFAQVRLVQNVNRLLSTPLSILQLELEFPPIPVQGLNCAALARSECKRISQPQLRIFFFKRKRGYTM